MKVGIGLPATIAGVEGAQILDWARRADAGPFSSLGIIDRLVYSNYEPLVTLAAVAAVTRRIRLMTTVLLAPLRNAGLLAKQAASLDALSGGRLTLGMGVGGRPDDFQAAPADFKTRGRRFEAQLAVMKKIWAGEPPAEGIGLIGPRPVQAGGPEILIGGRSPAAVRRVGRWGDGYISGGSADMTAIRQIYAIAEESWREAGRSGKPRLVGGLYCALGTNVKDRAGAYIRDYYSRLGPAADAMANAVPTTPEAVKAALQTFSDNGFDELILWPAVPDGEQVERFADLIG